jgi:hypothetical protein
MKYLIRNVREIDEELIHLEEAKTYLRVTGDHDDDLIRYLIKTSISYVENYIGKEVSTKEILAEISEFSGEIDLRAKNTREIINIQEIDKEDLLVRDEDYIIRYPKIIIKKKGVRSVIIRFIAGYDILPNSIKHSILTYLSLVYDKEILTSESLETVHNLLKPYRNLRLI